MRHKQSRTIRVRGNPIRGAYEAHGVGEDSGKYFRCWNCGFICDVERDELGDSESRSGASSEIYAAQYSSDNINETDGSTRQVGTPIYGTSNGVPLLVIASLRTGHVVLENGADSSPKGIRLNWQPKITGGCPFCGSKNYRGDY